MRFERDKAAETSECRKSGSAAARTQPIKAPGAYEQRHQRRDAQRYGYFQAREDREQKTDGVGIDDHQIHEIRRHHQDVIFKLRQQHEQRHQRERDEAGEQRPPRQRNSNGIEDSPRQQECRHRGDAGLGRQHDRQCEDMRQSDQGQPARPEPGRQSSNFVTQAQNEGTHGGALVPGNDLP